MFVRLVDVIASSKYITFSLADEDGARIDVKTKHKALLAIERDGCFEIMVDRVMRETWDIHFLGVVVKRLKSTYKIASGSDLWTVPRSSADALPGDSLWINIRASNSKSA